MRTVTTASNLAEAGFIQSILRDEGIESITRDAGIAPTGVYEIPIQVSETEYARALEIVARLTKPKSEPPARAHPSEGFPFLGIVGFVTIIWASSSAVMIFLAQEPSSNLAKRIGLALAGGGVSLLGGLFWGVMIALACLIIRPVYKKMKGA